jgi:hypothetical protein
VWAITRIGMRCGFEIGQSMIKARATSSIRPQGRPPTGMLRLVFCGSEPLLANDCRCQFTHSAAGAASHRGQSVWCFVGASPCSRMTAGATAHIRPRGRPPTGMLRLVFFGSEPLLANLCRSPFTHSAAGAASHRDAATGLLWERAPARESFIEPAQVARAGARGR